MVSRRGNPTGWNPKTATRQVPGGCLTSKMKTRHGIETVLDMATQDLRGQSETLRFEPAPARRRSVGRDTQKNPARVETPFKRRRFDLADVETLRKQHGIETTESTFSAGSVGNVETLENPARD